jgi:hypothetical protein
MFDLPLLISGSRCFVKESDWPSLMWRLIGKVKDGAGEVEGDNGAKLGHVTNHGLRLEIPQPGKTG